MLNLMFSIIFVAISLLASQVTGTALTACPTKETISVASNGAKYAICPNSDYQGLSVQILYGIQTLNACVQLCDNTPTCFKAVYNHGSKVCHFKSNYNTLTWAKDTRYDVIQLRNDVPELKTIAQCLLKETTYTGNGKTYKICQASDLQGASLKMIYNIQTAPACASICSTTTGCVKAVFDNIKFTCHIKGPEPKTTLTWVMNKRFTVIRLETSSNLGNVGKWSNLIKLSVIPVAGFVVPQFPDSSRLLFYSSWAPDAFGGASGMTQFADYNFKTGVTSQRQVTNTKHDMFCPGMSFLEDGRMAITGGSNAAAVTFYDPATNAFTKGPEMKVPRGYQTSVTTSEGKIFELGGSYSGGHGGKNGEVYDPATNNWTLLPNAKTAPMLTTDAEGVWRTDNHAWLFAWKDGSVFQAGPSKAQNWYSTKGSGSVVPAGIRDPIADAMCGVNVMYDAGKILTTGGSQSYTNSPATTRTHITTIDKPNSPASVERVADMNFPRGFANGVVLPDGTVLVTGGQRKSLVFTDTDGILPAELFDPVSKKWKVLSSQAVARNYHSISILLPDATVFTGGGGLCYVGKVGASTAGCNKAVDHADGQIFSPAYLFNNDGSLATRPVISAMSAATTKLGSTIKVTVAYGSTTQLVLVRMGSATHSINSDQRRIPLTNVSVSGNVYTVTLPSDSGVVIPGYYYLFAVSGTRVPSLAKTIRITRY